jgi:predicted TIM-barrel fold metal-dependent hydrolase
MNFDMHFHVVGKGRDIDDIKRNVYFYPDDNNLWFTRILYGLVDEDLKRLKKELELEGTIDTEEYLALVYKILATSEEIDSIVLLGLDAAFDPDSGKLMEKETDLWVSNEFLSWRVKELNDRLQAGANPANKRKRFYYGASVSPNRKNWQEELEFVMGDPDSVLVKLIPSVQHIDLKAPKHGKYFEFLASHNMPLLCHVGPEYSFPEGIRERKRDNFRYLAGPLDAGATVIAAHCATPVFPPPLDKNETKEFYRFMEKYNSSGKIRLWGDTSAFSLSTRITVVREILDTFPAEWLVNGSDFPIPIDGWIHLPFVTPDVTVEEYVQIQQTKNPIDKDVRIKRAHRFSDSILQNAEKVLRLPKTVQPG